ncbi:aspartyl-phosphate phosphatase Spo0E family protein [Bacillus sp. Gen3]|uniref:aspartyl-phosphate phosphatase Spo0E family protein n=1 Tax=Heyndrickxia oleronia TaxID=38875 RepID=UPI000990AAC2|nr:aspartyl-phosphate phosphatase Spo0E family protein [Bacillus sp. Gen3]QQZ07290.1 aspartyl-phosphate phosphatase Spo0E family protein [Heyndrickxia oleronia]
MINRKELSIKIEQKRQILNLFANEKGLTHPDTIRFSQELEKYLLNYQLTFIKFRHSEK